MYIFAALLTTIVHYIYFRFIDKGFIINTFPEILESNSFITISESSGMNGYAAQLKAMIDMMRSMTPINITMQLMSQNVFYGGVLSLITAPFVKKN
jgi:hypothetical protein